MCQLKIKSLIEKIFKNHSFLKKNILLFALGYLSSYAFAPYFYIPLLAIGISVLMFLITIETSKKKITCLSFLFGAGLGVGSLNWICHALLVDGGAYQFLIPLALLGLGLFLGLFFALPAFCASFFKTSVSRWLSFCAFFVFFEWVRSWLFTGFPWNLIGNIWTVSPAMLQFAGLVGVYGLSLLTLLFFTSLALLPQKRYFLTLLIVVCLSFLGGAFHIYESPKEMVWGVQLRLVQPNIKQSLKWDPDRAEENFSTLISLSKENNDKITHVIWPESAMPYYPEIDETARLRLMSAVRQGGTLLAGALRVVDLSKRQLANSLFVFDHLSNIQGYYDKSHLVPFGEYVPFRDVLKIDKLVPIPSDFNKGEGVRTMYIPKAPPVSPLICYEVIFPSEVVDKKKRPEWILNLTNDGWYGLSAGPYQHLSIAQMRAVEEGLPLVRATNNGVSAVINPYGEIIASLDLGEKGVLDSPLPRAGKRTLYSIYGNKIPLTLVLIILIFALLKNRKGKNI